VRAWNSKLGLVMLMVSAGCVTTGTYNRKVAELEATTAEHDRKAEEEKAALQAQIDGLKQQLAELGEQVTKTGAERDHLKASLDDATALIEQLKQRLEKLGQNVDKLTGERGQLAQGLADAKARLEELRRQEEAEASRAKAFHELLSKFRSMIDAGTLKIALRKGRMIIVLPNDVLFDSGRTVIKPEGRVSLAQVGKILASIADREFLVAGDTDNVPIHSERFPSNWELSTQRAIEVVKFLISNGVAPQVLGATGYGEFDPVATNDTPEHRALNRRIEIVLQPNISELPELPTADTSGVTPK
jgi:chemotaxis protein MotB